jgi:hypothetical protein
MPDPAQAPSTPPSAEKPIMSEHASPMGSLLAAKRRAQRWIDGDADGGG